MHLNKMKNFEAKALRRSEMKFYNLVKVGAQGRAGRGAREPRLPAAARARPVWPPTGWPILQRVQGSCQVGPGHGRSFRGLCPASLPCKAWACTLPPVTRRPESKALTHVSPLATPPPCGLSPVAPIGGDKQACGTFPRLPLLLSTVLSQRALASRWTQSPGFGFESQLRLE